MHELSADPTALAVRLRRWMTDYAEELEPFRSDHRSLDLAQAHAEDDPFQRLLYDADWARIGWPVECGGVGGGPAARAVVYDELWKAGYPLPERIDVLETVGPMLVHLAPSIAAVELPAFLRGDRMWTQCFSEPEAGSDLASLRTTARRDGDCYVLNGQKIWASYAHIADRAIALVRTGDRDSRHRGLTMLWVDLATPGISIVPIRDASGRDHFAEVFYDDVRVPIDSVIGEENRGWAAAMYLLQFERGMYAWIRQAWMHDVLSRVVRSSGGSLSDEMLARVADAYRLIAILRLRVASTVRQLDAGGAPGSEVSIDKILLATSEQRILDLLRDLRYPLFEIGDDADSDALRHEWFTSRAASIYGGAIDVQRDIVADRVVGLPRERKSGR
jgi:alkylation response protein AidB-like acyl-CoA dehydrogenase